MEFIENWTESEKQNGCECTVYLLTAWLMGAAAHWLCPASQEDVSPRTPPAGEKIRI